MRGSILLIAVAVICMVIVSGATGVRAQEDEEKYDAREFIIPNFAELNEKEADVAGMEILKKHRDNISELIRQVDDPDMTPDDKVWPIHLLGVFRANRAVPTLIRHIDMKRTKREPTFFRLTLRWPMHPAAQSLINIGRPASQQVIIELPDEPNELRRRLMVEVIHGVERAEIGVFILEKRLEQVETDQQKERLREAIDMLNEMLIERRR